MIFDDLRKIRLTQELILAEMKALNSNLVTMNSLLKRIADALAPSEHEVVGLDVEHKPPTPSLRS